MMGQYPTKEGIHTITKDCLNCGKKFIRYKSHARQTGAKFCSNKCGNSGKFSHMWLGDKASYGAIHVWLHRHKERPKKCSKCGKKGKKNGRRWSIQWANIDNVYKRKIEDYIALCSKCHINFDAIKRGGTITNQFGIWKLRSLR